MDDLTDTIRTVNVFLGAVLMYACCMRITRDWPLWSRRERVVRAHLIGYLFVVSAGTLWLLLNLPEVWRAVAVLVVNVSLGLALWRNRHDPVR